MFQKILVSQNFMDEKRGGHHDFPSKICCLTVAEKFRRGKLCVQKISGIEKCQG